MATFPLDRAALGKAHRVTGVSAPTVAPHWARWLEEIGFVAGESVMLTARAALGDPLVVRVGSSTFALRRAEAACIQVEACA